MISEEEATPNFIKKSTQLLPFGMMWAMEVVN